MANYRFVFTFANSKTKTLHCQFFMAIEPINIRSWVRVESNELAV